MAALPVLETFLISDHRYAFAGTPQTTNNREATQDGNAQD
jgi:hypothetical protein